MPLQHFFTASRTAGNYTVPQCGWGGIARAWTGEMEGGREIGIESYLVVVVGRASWLGDRMGWDALLLPSRRAGQDIYARARTATR